MMKRLNNNLWHLSLALPCMLLAVGCDNNTAPEVESNEPVELQINPTVALTRGVIQGGSGQGFSKDAKVAVYAIGDDYTSSNNYAVYTLGEDNAWSNTATDNNKIFLTNKAATIYAYYPTDNKYDNNSQITVTPLVGDENTAIAAVDNASGTAIAAADGEVDYMYATAVSNVTNKSGNGVTLAMQHAMSMISFCVKKDASYAGTGSLTNIKLEDTNGSGTTLGTGDTGGLKMDITSGAISGTLKDATYKRKITNGYTLTTSADKKFSILVLPTTASIESNIKATFTIDGADYDVTLTAPTNGSDTSKSGYLLAGSNYLYTVTLKGTGLAISSVTVAAWTDGTFGDGDDNLEIN